MELRIVRSLGDVGLDDRQWNALAARSDTDSIFQTYQWTRSWLKAYGENYEPMFIVASDAGSVCGVAPLVAERLPARTRVIRFLGDGRSDYCDFLVTGGKPGVVEALLLALLADRSWDVIELDNVRTRSGMTELAHSVCMQAGYGVSTAGPFVCPTLLIRGHEGAAHRIFNKPSLRRRENRFRREGPLVCRHLTTMAEVEPYLDSFFEQHIARWAPSGHPSLFLNPHTRIFYRDLAASLAERGWLLFTVVEFNRRPVAFHFGFDYSGAVLWYKPSFDLSYASRSPGLVLVRHLIAYAVDNKRREMDFSVGDEPFKRRFTNSCQTTVNMTIYRSPVRFTVARCRHWLVRAIRRFEARDSLACHDSRTAPQPSGKAATGQQAVHP